MRSKQPRPTAEEKLAMGWHYDVCDALKVLRNINRMKRMMTKGEIMKTILAMMMVLITVLVMVSCATAVTFQWEMTDMNTVTGFNLYKGTASKVYGTPPINIPLANSNCVAGTPTVCTYTMDIPNGAYYFAMTALAGTDESSYSNEVFARLVGNPKNIKVK